MALDLLKKKFFAQYLKEKWTDFDQTLYDFFILTRSMLELLAVIFMPPKELWEAYSNRTVRPSVRQSVRPSVRQSVRPAFVSGPYLLYSLR